MSAKRKRNPSGVAQWAQWHPWMTFLLVASGITAAASILGPRPSREQVQPLQGLRNPFL